METVYEWNAKRAGGRITIYGKKVDGTARRIPHVDVIRPEGNKVIATDYENKRYHLTLDSAPRA